MIHLVAYSWGRTETITRFVILGSKTISFIQKNESSVWRGKCYRYIKPSSVRPVHLWRPFLTSILLNVHFWPQFYSTSILVHGKAVPETGQVSVVEYENPFKRELIWDPVAAGEWTFLGPSEYDSGFRVDLSQILTLRRPATEGNGLRYLVIQERTTVFTPTWSLYPFVQHFHFSDSGVFKRLVLQKLKDGAVLPSLHFTPGGVDRTCRCLNIFFKFKELSKMLFCALV